MELKDLVKKLEETNLLDERETFIKESSLSDDELSEMMAVFAFGMHLCGFSDDEIDKPASAFSMFLSLWSDKSTRAKILEMKQEQVVVAKTMLKLAK